MPGAESEGKDAVATTQQDTNLFVQSQILDIHRLLSQHTGKLNTLDQRSAQTKDQLQKQQQLEASKHAIISSWPDSATKRDREQAIEKLVEKEGLRRMHTCTQTLKSKGGLAHFSIVEFYTKEARNDFLDMVKKDMLTCHGQIQVGRAQIPKYQREADQPFRCAIAVYAQIAGRQQRYKPIWELTAIWHGGEWILIAEPAEHDKTQITIHVRAEDQEAFTASFGDAWAKWGQQHGVPRKPDAYRAQDHFTITIKGITPEKAAEYDQKYNAQSKHKQSTASATQQEREDETMGPEPRAATARLDRGLRPPPAREGGKGKAPQGAR
ncbi:unnamed protein product [Symbiodinium sp. CCMP2592]|nr:unnamed protein product [Symbiodinium sp. CCMP2592]